MKLPVVPLGDIGVARHCGFDIRCGV